MTRLLPGQPHPPLDAAALTGVRWSATYLRRLAQACPATHEGQGRARALRAAGDQLLAEIDEAAPAVASRTPPRAHDAPEAVLEDDDAEAERIDDA